MFGVPINSTNPDGFPLYSGTLIYSGLTDDIWENFAVSASVDISHCLYFEVDFNVAVARCQHTRLVYRYKTRFAIGETINAFRIARY